MTFAEEPGVSPEGPYTAWVDDERMKAEVRRQAGNSPHLHVAQRFKGETAWSDAIREAGDRNARLQNESS